MKITRDEKRIIIEGLKIYLFMLNRIIRSDGTTLVEEVKLQRNTTINIIQRMEGL